MVIKVKYDWFRQDLSQAHRRFAELMVKEQLFKWLIDSSNFYFWGNYQFGQAQTIIHIRDMYSIINIIQILVSKGVKMLSWLPAKAWPSQTWDMEVPCCSTARNGFSSYTSWADHSVLRPNQKLFLMHYLSKNGVEKCQNYSTSFKIRDFIPENEQMQDMKIAKMSVTLTRQGKSDSVGQSFAQWPEKERTNVWGSQAPSFKF